jgi:hypothetical protein
MSIFKKSSDQLPDVIKEAFFDNIVSMDQPDEFSSLLKEANTNENRSVYENRLKAFKKAQAETHEFSKPEPTKYSDLPGGIRRVGYGERFSDENPEKIRSISYDNNKLAENLLTNGFSIWEPEFDELSNAFIESQKQSDAVFDRRTFAEKKAAAAQKWESDNLNSIRENKVLPYRGLGIARVGNEQPINHGKFNSSNDFIAETNDNIHELIRESNRDRKSKISRQGAAPEETYMDKEAVHARTIEALHNNSDFLVRFAEEISLNDK